MEETVVAPATPSGRGGVSIVRISGPSAPHIGEGLCGELPSPWCFKPCLISGGDEKKLDTGLVVFFAAPRSYTGEDVVEIHCHGNPLIVDSIVAEAVLLGARIAEPGEFTKRAFLNDKIDLAQAESVADLIAAQTSSALVAASSSLSGDFSELINKTIDGVVDVRVVVEACLDFSDEESVSVFDEKKSFVRQGILDSLGVVILGPPNCGKSTLLNALAKEDVAIVSNTPGTTRDLLRVVLDLGGLPVEFIDTAGLHEDTEEVVEVEGMRRAVSAVDGADLVVLMSCVGEVFNPPIKPSTKTLRVFNKIDIFPDKNPSKIPGVCISALTGENLEGFVEAVFSCFGVGSGIEVPVLARRRHLGFLEKALDSLGSALSVLDGGGDLVLVAEDLKEVQSRLGFITRPVTSDELLGGIFSEFCIGK